MKKPNFFIIGAPKCGTSALAHWLAQHPDVFFSPIKEPHFFNTDSLTRTETLSRYESLFSSASPECQAVGEGSTRYLYSRAAVPNILEYSPSARFIVCLRNPLEMAPALHGERLSQGCETEASFDTAWRLQPKRAQGRCVPATVASDPSMVLYGEFCQLGQQLQRLYSIVPKERTHTVLLDDIRTTPDVEYDRILEFLGLSKEQDVDFAPVNTSKRTKSAALAVAAYRLASIKRRTGIKKSFGIAEALRALNISRGAREAIGAELDEELRKYFEPDIELLSRLIGRDLSVWLT